MNKQVLSDFLVSILKGLRIIALLVGGAALIVGAIFIAGLLLPDLFEYWPISTLSLSELSYPARHLVNGLAWLVWSLLAILLLIVLALVGGFNPRHYEQDFENKCPR